MEVLNYLGKFGTRITQLRNLRFKICPVSDTNATQYMWLHSIIQFSLIITCVLDVPMSGVVSCICVTVLVSVLHKPEVT